jgi:hypothetical protein
VLVKVLSGIAVPGSVAAGLSVACRAAAAHDGQDPPQEPRTAMRYVKPGGEAVAEITSILGPPRRKH